MSLKTQNSLLGCHELALILGKKLINYRQQTCMDGEATAEEGSETKKKLKTEVKNCLLLLQLYLHIFTHALHTKRTTSLLTSTHESCTTYL